jgi:hypothetical protein
MRALWFVLSTSYYYDDKKKENKTGGRNSGMDELIKALGTLDNYFFPCSLVIIFTVSKLLYLRTIY